MGRGGRKQRCRKRVRRLSARSRSRARFVSVYSAHEFRQPICPTCASGFLCRVLRLMKWRRWWRLAPCVTV
ncbi:hypothetical protein Hanom_Chr07g00599411 [Helianthus anomalus]